MLCHTLNMTYTELKQQPAWFVNTYQPFLVGKNKADEAKAKNSNQER